MAGEAKLFYGSSKTLEANGGSIANNAIAQANDASYDVSADGSNYPSARFVASFTFSVAPTEGSRILLLARPLDIDSTNDAEAPEATFLFIRVGSFPVNNVTTAQYAECYVDTVPFKADYYLYNDATGQTISAGWTLKVNTPYTIGPA
jgi:hypothetical protein